MPPNKLPMPEPTDLANSESKNGLVQSATNAMVSRTDSLTGRECFELGIIYVDSFDSFITCIKLYKYLNTSFRIGFT